MSMTISAATIRTDRLRLTPLVAGDADEMVAVQGDVRMHEFTGGDPWPLDELQDRYRRLAVGHSADGDSADVAWEVGVPWQGSGIASEAASTVVDWLAERGVRTITAYIHPDHHASARVASRAGLMPTIDNVDGEVVWRRVTPAKGTT